VPPGQRDGQYVRWYYPSQMPYGAMETGAANTGEAPAGGAFLTLPFMGPHYVTSLFDHCSPDYQVNGRLCRWDGEVVAKSVGGPDPGFSEGYAQTPGQQVYLYYDGHDGYDYGLYYEPVAAAAAGVVKLAGWVVPSCHTCLSGLTVEIDHGNGLLSYYGHMSQIGVHVGQYVPRGMVLGRSGVTGNATGPPWGTFSNTGSGCAISGVSNSGTPNYNGQWVTWEIPIPGTYTCNSADPLGCWTKLQFVYPPGTNVSDTTTWSAYILGEPVRLIQ